MIRHGFAATNGIVWHYAAAGEPEAPPLMVFLHGFPEHWRMWAKLLPAFAADGRLAVAPDLTGYNLSSKPEDVERYRTRHLLADLDGFVDTFPPKRRFTLVAHDWGGALAWAYALKRPERLDRLVIVNAVHPGAFQREIARNPAQAAASQYIHALRAEGAEEAHAADGFALLRRSFRQVEDQGLLTAEDAAAWRAAWSRPGALTGMLNWYRAMRMSPPSAERGADAGMYDDDSLIVRVPTLVIWGDRDEALLPGCVEGLERWVPNLRVEHIPDGSHWVVHEQPDRVVALMRAWLG